MREQVDEQAWTSLPPRPSLSRFQMTFGFMLTPTKFLDQCHAQNGDYFTLKPAPHRTLVITADPAAVKQVFTGDPNLLHAGEANEILLPLLGDRSVLLLDGSEHMRQRKLMLPPFHGERMRTYQNTMRATAEWHIADWPRNRGFEALPSMQAVTLDVIMRAIFGVDDEAARERLAKPLRSQLDMVSSRVRIVALMLSSRTALSGTGGAWAIVARARKQADELLFEEIRSRRADPDAAGRDDIFSLLLAARDEDGQPLTDQEVRDELMTLLMAGHETTATALAWVLERITRTPHVLERLTDDPTDDYVDAVVKETLRLRPVVPAVARTLKAPMSFGGWDLPAGVSIAPSIYLLHRRADLYPDPTAFKPERFLGKTPGTYEWIPFGGGVRRCLGASFALMEMNVVLKAILSSVKLKPARDAPESTTRRAITFAPSGGGRIAVA
jgi:cytochrome P450